MESARKLDEEVNNTFQEASPRAAVGFVSGLVITLAAAACSHSTKENSRGVAPFNPCVSVVTKDTERILNVRTIRQDNDLRAYADHVGTLVRDLLPRVHRNDRP